MLVLFYYCGGGGSLVLFIFGKLSRTSQANIKSTFKGLRDHKLGNGSALLCTLCSLPVCRAAVWRPRGKQQRPALPGNNDECLGVGALATMLPQTIKQCQREKK